VVFGWGACGFFLCWCCLDVGVTFGGGVVFFFFFCCLLGGCVAGGWGVACWLWFPGWGGWCCGGVFFFGVGGGVFWFFRGFFLGFGFVEGFGLVGLGGFFWGCFFFLWFLLARQVIRASFSPCLRIMDTHEGSSFRQCDLACLGLPFLPPKAHETFNSV